ncbi:hypothetical protein AVEN_35272-1 [Araneus ventricosus]|uniref:Uncharacterized protein n=1 Tax=Araneus ventricosus TaxID=182803 RepID=A0A4Y2EIA5_ARAVE|nr:hypothetical protein AVEN_35272-1 [Araneus ventricosus]
MVVALFYFSSICNQRKSKCQSFRIKCGIFCSSKRDLGVPRLTPQAEAGLWCVAFLEDFQRKLVSICVLLGGNVEKSPTASLSSKNRTEPHLMHLRL